MNMFDKKIYTKRLMLRRISITDVEDMFAYTSDSRNTLFLHWEAHKSKDKVIEFIKKTIEDYSNIKNRYTWGIELVEQKKLIGAVSIFNISYLDRRGEVSYILNSNYSGNSFSTEAVKKVIDFTLNGLEFNRIEARCTHDNKASEAVMKKVGMRFEGTLKKYWNIKNRFKDVIIYGIVNN